MKACSSFSTCELVYFICDVLGQVSTELTSQSLSPPFPPDRLQSLLKPHDSLFFRSLFFIVLITPYDIIYWLTVSTTRTSWRQNYVYITTISSALKTVLDTVWVISKNIQTNKRTHKWKRQNSWHNIWTLNPAMPGCTPLPQILSDMNQNFSCFFKTYISIQFPVTCSW